MKTDRQTNREKKNTKSAAAAATTTTKIMKAINTKNGGK